jgi:hypothetical protein
MAFTISAAGAGGNDASPVATIGLAVMRLVYGVCFSRKQGKQQARADLCRCVLGLAERLLPAFAERDQH